MQTVADRPEAPTAIRTDLGAIFVSLELSRSTWLITSLSPGGGEKIGFAGVVQWQNDAFPNCLEKLCLLPVKSSVSH